MDCTSRSCRCNISITVSSPSVITQWSLTTHCLKNLVLSWMSKTHGPLCMRVTVCRESHKHGLKSRQGLNGLHLVWGSEKASGRIGAGEESVKWNGGPRPHETAAMPEAERVSERGCHTLGGRQDVAEKRAKHRPMGV